MPCTVLHKIKRATIALELAFRLNRNGNSRFSLSRVFLTRTGAHPGASPGQAFARKRIWLVKGNACAQQVRCARRLPKWHGYSGEVFANQAVTPSQEQAICCRAFLDSIGPKRRFDDA